MRDELTVDGVRIYESMCGLLGVVQGCECEDDTSQVGISVDLAQLARNDVAVSLLLIERMCVVFSCRREILLLAVCLLTTFSVECSVMNIF